MMMYLNRAELHLKYLWWETAVMDSVCSVMKWRTLWVWVCVCVHFDFSEGGSDFEDWGLLMWLWGNERQLSVFSDGTDDRLLPLEARFLWSLLQISAEVCEIRIRDEFVCFLFIFDCLGQHVNMKSQLTMFIIINTCSWCFCAQFISVIAKGEKSIFIFATVNQNIMIFFTSET